MNAQEIRKAYIDYYKERGHAHIPRALLVPQNDPSTLFTGSGMQPLVPYLLGEEHPLGKRLVDSQTCLRSQDIEEVGDNRHTTFFEMLGNWSLGDYFKSEQLPWIFEFLTKKVGLDPSKLYVSVFIGDKTYGIPKDTDSGNIWQILFANEGIEAKEIELGSEADGSEKGMQDGRIFYYDASKNWWCRNGKIKDMPIGEPGGPSTEIFYEFDFVTHNPEYGTHCHPNCDCGRFVEIGNNVLMEYVRTENGFDQLPSKNIDFGGGLERIAMASLNDPDAFKISVLLPIIQKLEELSVKKYDSHTESMRVIADHLRGATFLAVDGVVPSNKEQGYVMRRLLRRAIRQAFEIGIEQNFLEEVIPIIAEMYESDFPEVAEHKQKVIEVLCKEEKAFRHTLRKGLRELNNIYNRNNGSFSGEDMFILSDTFGFPLELSLEVIGTTLENANLDPNWRQQYEDKLQQQRERSQTASKGVFKGGLADHSEETTKLHTATHLMYEALRRVLGQHVIQRGSNVTAERTRFDFSHDSKVTREQLDEVENIVNEQIDADLSVNWKEYPTEKAFELGAKGAFGDKYGDNVKVYVMSAENQPAFSIEICGGPHVERTGVLAENGKRFKIVKEEASSAGVRRIKAILG